MPRLLRTVSCLGVLAVTACGPEEKQKYIATLAGPAFTFAVMWIGALAILKGATPLRRHWGFAVIFAQLPMQRMHGPIGGFNDEWYAVANLWGASELNQWLTTGAVWALAIPPLIVAYRAIDSWVRILWFALFFLLLPYLVWGPVFFGLEYLLVERGVLDQAIIGIAALFLIAEAVTFIGHLISHRWLDPHAGRKRSDSPSQPYRAEVS